MASEVTADLLDGFNNSQKVQAVVDKIMHTNYKEQIFTTLENWDN